MSIVLETEKHLQILEALAVYKFLTVSQMTELGLAGEKQRTGYLNSVLVQLRERKRKATIGCHKHARMSGREYVYFLTEWGVQDLVLNGWNGDEIKRPVGVNPYVRDYNHRKHSIDLQIKLNEWVEAHDVELDFYDAYYDYKGNARKASLQSKTTIIAGRNPIRKITPDAIFMVSREERAILYAFELDMGRDVKKVLRQIIGHKLALESGAVASHYDLELPHVVPFVFKHPTTMRSTMERLRLSKAVTSDFYPYFLFATYEEAITSNMTSWRDCTGTPKPLFF